MSEQEILKLEKCVVKDTKKTHINVSVYMVARACFNDERLVEDLTIKIEDIKDKDLYWFDLFLGRKANNKTKIAIAYIDGNDVYFLKDDGEKIKVFKKDYSIIASEDHDDSSIIVTHIW